jgi:hypothetical protein
MTIRHPAIGNVIRVGATLSLLVWVLGFLVCQTDCMSRPWTSRSGVALAVSSNQQAQSGQAKHHEGGSPCHSQHDEDPDTRKNAGCCCSIQVLIQESKAPEVVTPLTIVVLILPSELATVASGKELDRPESYLRAEGWRDWTHTPEVYLGPGIHSLAPPTSSFLV